jgi:hypothetical protein
MAYFDVMERSLRLKVCYAGAQGAGRRTNLAWLARHVSRGKGTPLDDIAEGTPPPWSLSVPLAPNMLPGPLAARGHRGWAMIHSTPTSSEIGMLRALESCDAVVFVARSSEGRIAESLRAFGELCRTMTALEGDTAEAPLVVQYNHRDSPDAVSVPVLREALLCMATGPGGCWPDLPGGARDQRFAEVEAVASDGKGVEATLDRAIRGALATSRMRSYLDSVRP